MNSTWRKRLLLRYDFVGFLMISPFYLLFLIFTFIPIFIGLSFSFTNYDLYRKFDFIGLENYAKLWNDPIFIKSIYNTLLYATLTIVPGLILGLLAAVLLNEKLYGFKFYRVSFYMPYIISMVAASMIWLSIYDPGTGLANRLIGILGLPAQTWLHNPDLAMYSIAILSIWKVIGFNMLIFLAGLQAIPSDYYEAAIVDGANANKRFFYITLPLLRPTTFFLFVTSVIGAFNVFEQVNIMTSGGPVNSTTTIVHQIFTRAFTEFNMGYASAQAMILFVFVAIITLMFFVKGSRRADLDMG